MNKLIQGNCLEIMPRLIKEGIKIDLILTDPPYNIKFNKYNTFNDNLTDDEYKNLISSFKGYPLAIIQYPEETMKYFVPVFGHPNKVVAWCYNGNIARRFRLINFYNIQPDFNKVKQPYKNLNDKRIKKRIKEGSKGSPLYEWWDDIQLVKNVSKEKTFHPCPIPIKLVERIIKITTNEGDIVLDPFAGSMTTAIACINTNRNYICIEKDKTYFELGKKRVKNYKLQINMAI